MIENDFHVYCTALSSTAVCGAVYVILLAKSVHADKDSCPAGLPQINCFRAPCTLPSDTCIDDPSAICTVDACNACGNHFVNSFGKRIQSMKCKYLTTVLKCIMRQTQ